MSSKTMVEEKRAPELNKGHAALQSESQRFVVAHAGQERFLLMNEIQREIEGTRCHGRG